MGKIVPTKKVYLEEAIAELGLTGMPVIRALKSLLMYSQDDDLPIYFESEITGVNVNTEFEEVRDTVGNIDGVRILDGDCEIIEGLKTLVSATANTCVDEAKFNISVFRFKYGDHEYYASDETESWLEAKVFNPNNFYFDRDELINFLKSMDRNNRSQLAEDISKSTNHRLPSKQLQREIAFKFWLATKAVKSIRDDATFQLCYDAIDSPTQDEVWAKLQAIDNKLFAQGRDEFFKKQKFIKFQLGTGKGRNQ